MSTEDSQSKNNLWVEDISKQVTPEGDKPAFLFHNVLSAEECQEWIDRAEEKGFNSLENEYPPEYRNNVRCIIFDEDFAAMMFERCKEHIPGELSHPYHESRHWKPVGMNECLRLCKYEAGGKFGAHCDASYIRVNFYEETFLTFMIYLNGPLDGGDTVFLDQISKKELLRVSPEAGMALVFQHNIYHCGQKLESGEKYLLRSDVLYRYPAKQMIDEVVDDDDDDDDNDNDELDS